MGRTVVAALTLLLLATSVYADRPGEAYRGKELEEVRWPGSGKRVIIDVRLFWTYRFEHEKETILTGRIESLRHRVDRPSAEFFRFRRVTIFDPAARAPNSWIRLAAVMALGKIGGEAALPVLLERVENDPDPEVIRSALLALGLTGEKKAVAHLAKALFREGWHHHSYAALALGLSGLEEARIPLRKAWLIARKEVPADEDYLCCLAVALGAVGMAEDVPVLAAPIADKRQERLKIHVCQALGRIGGPKARDVILRAWKDRHAFVQTAAILALGRFEGRRVRQVLLEGEQSGWNHVKCASLISLSRLGTSSALVAKNAERPTTNVYAAMHAAFAQGEFGRTDSIPWRLERLEPRKWRKLRDENVTAIAMSLGLLREARATVHTRELMSNKSLGADSRGYCAFALGCMGDRTQAGAIREAMKKPGVHDDFLRSGCWALALLGGKEDIPFLMTLLEPEPKHDKYVRGAAAIAIGLLGDRETLGELVTLAKESDHGSVRALAIAAIGWIADKDPVPRLPRLFHGLYDRQAADPIREAWSLL